MKLVLVLLCVVYYLVDINDAMSQLSSNDKSIAKSILRSLGNKVLVLKPAPHGVGKKKRLKHVSSKGKNKLNSHGFKGFEDNPFRGDNPQTVYANHAAKKVKYIEFSDENIFDRFRLSDKKARKGAGREKVSIPANGPLLIPAIAFTIGGEKNNSKKIARQTYSEEGEGERDGAMFKDADKDQDDSGEANPPEHYEAEVAAGDMADMTGHHRHVPTHYAYDDLARRFVLQYPYTEVQRVQAKEVEAESQLDEAIREAIQQNLENERLVPIKAKPELVIAIAQQSALLEASKPVNPSDEFVQNSLLRSGDYWNGFWKEDVPDPQVNLRSSKNKETARVTVLPGSRLHQLVTFAKKISPRLLYIINSNKDF